MRTIPLLLGIMLTMISATPATTDEKPSTDAKGVVIDLRGPPKDGNFKLDYLITLEGEKEPTRHTVSHAGWVPTALQGHIIGWKGSGFVLEKAGDTRLRFVGKLGPDGKLVPVVRIELESKDLSPKELPMIVNDPNKG